MQFLNDNWPTLVSIGGLFAAIWGLSLASLKSIRDSKHATPATQDAAAVAMIGLVIVMSMGSAAGLGYAFLQDVVGALFGAGIFAIPFAAMAVSYCVSKCRGKKDKVESGEKKDDEKTEDGTGDTEEDEAIAHALTGQADH